MMRVEIPPRENKNYNFSKKLSNTDLIEPLPDKLDNVL